MKRPHWIAVALLLAVFGLMVSSIGRKSATVDEQAHLFRGAAYLRTGATHFLLGHPLGASVWSALPLVLDPALQLPTESAAWADGDWSLSADAFLWRSGNDSQRLIWLGRVPVIMLTLLLGALTVRWASELASGWAGVLAGAVLLLDPTVLAHGRLVTGDMALALFFTLAVYAQWRYLAGRGTGWVNILLLGLAAGLAALSKFNAGLLVPILGILAVGAAWRRRSFRPILTLIPAALVSVAVLWVFSGFDLTPLPGGAFWEDLRWELAYFGGTHGSYFNGAFSVDGWWFYFPAAYLLKTPLPTLILLLAAIGLAFTLARRHVRGLTHAVLLLPVAVYVGVSLTSSLNIGVRYLLPVLPFIAVWIAVIFAAVWQATPARWPRWVAGAAGVALAVVALIACPHYIPYFNQIAGGPTNGWRWLSDSNVDWGQDLPALAAWQAQNPDDEPLHLSYFGTAHPSAYDIAFEPLPMWPAAPEQGDPARQAFFPADPAPGTYALGVTSLHGVVLDGATETFGWFRDREPDARLGDSIFVYAVPARGAPVDVAFGGAVPAALSAEQHARLNSNDVRPRWFDPSASFVWPGGERAWVAATLDRPDPLLANLWPGSDSVAPGDVSLWPLEAFVNAPDGQPVAFGDALTLLDVQVSAEHPDEYALVSTWQVEQVLPETLKLFVHAVDSAETGRILTQWDGIDVDPGSLRPGDRFAQVHRFPAAGAPAALLLGAYDGATGVRPAEPVEVLR